MFPVILTVKNGIISVKFLQSKTKYRCDKIIYLNTEVKHQKLAFELNFQVPPVLRIGPKRTLMDSLELQEKYKNA